MFFFNKKDMWGHEYHAMGTGDDGHSSKREAVSALKADHKHHISGAYMKEEAKEDFISSHLIEAGLERNSFFFLARLRSSL